MGVQVEEAGGDDRTGRVELPLAVGGETAADLGDAPVSDPDVGGETRPAECE